MDVQPPKSNGDASSSTNENGTGNGRTPSGPKEKRRSGNKQQQGDGAGTSRTRNNSENSTASNAPQQGAPNGELVSIGSRAINRVLGWPVVDATVNAASDYYLWIKDSNSLVRWTLSVTESTYNFTCTVVIYASRPFKIPISFVDNAADVSLKKFEESFPVVLDDPSVVWEKSKAMVQPGVQVLSTAAVKVKDTANFVLSNSLAKLAIKHVADNFLQASDAIVEWAIPNTVQGHKTVADLDEDPVMHMVNQIQNTGTKIFNAVLTMRVRS